MALLSFRVMAGLYVLGCFALLSIAQYFQYVMGLEPCLLCMLQRGAVGLVAVIALVGVFHGPKGWGQRLYGAGMTLASLLGLGLAGRQVWLQSLPADQVPACAPSFDYMMEVFPLTEVVMTALRGSGDCAKIDWAFLGLSMAGWMMIIFAGMAAVALWLMARRPS